MKRQGGFTPAEVLIAVSILALVMVVLGQTLGSTALADTHLSLIHLLRCRRICRCTLMVASAGTDHLLTIHER